MNDTSLAGIDHHMAGDVDQVVAPQRGGFGDRDGRADGLTLHVGVAQHGLPEVAKRLLHQPRAVDPEKTSSGPQIGAAQIKLGGRHQVGRTRRFARETAGGEEAAAVFELDIGAAAGLKAGSHHHDRAVPRQEVDDPRAQIGLGIAIDAERGDVMRRRRRFAEFERRRLDITDITVALRLTPGMAVALVKDARRLAVMEECVERRVGSRGAPHRRQSDRDPRRPALGIARRGHAAAERRVGEIVADRVKPRIEVHGFGARGIAGWVCVTIAASNQLVRDCAFHMS